MHAPFADEAGAAVQGDGGAAAAGEVGGEAVPGDEVCRAVGCVGAGGEAGGVERV